MVNRHFNKLAFCNRRMFNISKKIINKILVSMTMNNPVEFLWYEFISR